MYRTWDPNYPNKYYIEHVTADFEPTCPMKELDVPGHYEFVSDCRMSERHDIWSDFTIVYAVVQGPMTEGFRAIGDAPSESSPQPLVIRVTDGNGVKLKHSIYRQGKQWYIHYTFAQPTAKRAYYTVHVAYQIQRALTGTIGGDNTFRANWLQEWNAPVKQMIVLFSFPAGFRASSYRIQPETSLEGDDMPSCVTSVCCGERRAAAMERCTNDVTLGKLWAKGGGACQNQTVQLETSLAVAKTAGGALDEGLPLKDLYRVTFSPGIVDDISGDAVNRSSYVWVFAVLGVLLFPAFAALVYFTYSVGKSSADDDDMPHKSS